MYLLGGNAFTWKLQHNVLHHTFTNITGMDDDIRERNTIRLSPHVPLKKHHRYQHIYATFLYCLMTLSIVLRDFGQLRSYNRSGLTARQKANPKREYFVMVFSKLLYFGFIASIPFLFPQIVWWKLLIGFCTVHFTGGLIMSMIFQLAHVVEGAEHPLPSEDGVMDNEWAIHQLETTVDFARDSRILGWYIGGLNYQVEHHLFPHISHVHYPAISKIVEQTAREYGVVYHTKGSFFSAFISHLKMLKILGRAEAVPQPAL
jgi:linoleoyl-CoA desaturase